MGVAMSKEHPILFDGDMVKATLQGKKTQTRVVIKPQPFLATDVKETPNSYEFYSNDGYFYRVKKKYQIGNKLWVRETFFSFCEITEYKATAHKYELGQLWKPSVHMPRWRSRITLEIINVRVERVQNISGLDVLAEGINPPIPKNVDASPPPDGYDKWNKKRQDEWATGMARTMVFAQNADARNCFDEFQKFWDSINKKRDYGWDKDPYVWVIEFKRI